MSLRDLVLDVVTLVAAAGIGFGLGYGHGEAHGVLQMNTKVLNAQQAQSSAQRAAADAQNALAQVRAQLATQQAALQAASDRAAQALRDRATLQAQLTQSTRARIHQDQEDLHETDCAALARLPVCPVLAHRLFAVPAQADSGTGAASH